MRSRIICSTSLPTYPISVNFVASTLIKGDWVNLASFLAISVLPQPVGPIIKMFLGMISSRKFSSFMLSLLHRLRSAMATAFFASS